MLRIYRVFISPVLVLFFGHACRFKPTCSEYAEEAISRYGIVKGGVKSIVRVIKCNPLTKPGYDPVS